MVGILLGRARADGEGSGCLRSLAPEIPRLRGLVPGRWGPRQRPCPGGFHTQRAGSGSSQRVQEQTGAKPCNLRKGEETPAVSCPVRKGSLAPAEGLLLGSASMISAMLLLT